MHKLNDTQRVLLATAAQREDHSLLPLPEGMRMSMSVTATQRKRLALTVKWMAMRLKEKTGIGPSREGRSFVASIVA